MRQGRVEDGTVIRTLNQTNGRGQRGAKWHFDKGKSLAISVLKKWRRDPQSDLFHLQCVISLAIFESLRALGQAQWHIKWPNDIMADGLKICGILIEHHYQGSLYATVVGLGVNVNNDPIKGLPKAGSIAGVLGKKLDLDALDISLSDAIFKAMDQFNPKTVQADLTAYNAKLYLKNSERQFAGSDGRS